MILKTKIGNSIEVRCVNIINKKTDPKYGLKCNQRLLHKNSEGDVAGEIKCKRCGALYDIKNNDLILIKIEGGHK